MPIKDPERRRQVSRESAARCRRERPELQKKARLKYEYGLAWDVYLGLLESQGYLCAVCCIPLGPTSGCVEHCHETGNIRGIVCADCNKGLGFFRDDPERMEAAAAYIRRSRCRPGIG